LEKKKKRIRLQEMLLMLASVVITLAVALGLVRWLAPGLLGGPRDLVVVRSSKEVPPFFQGVFRQEDYAAAQDLIIPDPLILRARPLLPDGFYEVGPHDILGFRNRAVPNIADVIVVGDSQTYGNNAFLEETWPRLLVARIKDRPATVYSMAVGGWAGVEYAAIIPYAMAFQPRVVVVAFYTGNDPLESFLRAYGNDAYEGLRPNPALSVEDAPALVFPAPESEKWPVTFSGGVQTVFTPKLRLASNLDVPAVRAGYAIMKAAARMIAARAVKGGARPVFTIIPTKELVFRKRIETEGIQPPEDYTALVEAEAKNLQDLAEYLGSLPGAAYVDVAAPLQEAARENLLLYKSNMDGHPLARGQDVIARALLPVVTPLLPILPRGPFVVEAVNGGERVLLAIRGRYFWVADPRALEQGGWKREDLPRLTIRDLGGMPYGGVLNKLPPAGP